MRGLKRRALTHCQNISTSTAKALAGLGLGCETLTSLHWAQAQPHPGREECMRRKEGGAPAGALDGGKRTSAARRSLISGSTRVDGCTAVTTGSSWAGPTAWLWSASAGARVAARLQCGCCCCSVHVIIERAASAGIVEGVRRVGLTTRTES